MGNNVGRRRQNRHHLYGKAPASVSPAVTTVPQVASSQSFDSFITTTMAVPKSPGELKFKPHLYVKKRKINLPPSSPTLYEVNEASASNVSNYFKTPDDFAAMNRPPFAFQAVSMSPSDHTMMVNMSELRRLLTRSDLRDKPVMVLSIAGLLRQGKSFILNFFIRYLEQFEATPGFLAKLSSSTRTSWLNTESFDSNLHPKKHLPGHVEYPKWQRTTATPMKSNSSNLFVWSKPYYRYVPGVGEIGILLMDAQTSTFECPQTAKDSATVFAMSTVLASVQLFNVQGEISESDLQHLHMFLEYARLVMGESRIKPFQNLVFLVRDWSRPYEFPYGFEGGKRYLTELRGACLPSSCSTSSTSSSGHFTADSYLLTPMNYFSATNYKRHHVDLERIWQRIDDCFDCVSAYLMPHPGNAVATSEKYTGPLKYIDAAFLDSMRQFVPKILNDDSLVLKTINNTPVTCANLFDSLKNYAETFQSHVVPTLPDSLISSAAHLHFWTVFDAAKTIYEEQMEQFVDESRNFVVSSDDLTAEHDRLVGEALKLIVQDRGLVADEQLQDVYARRLSNFAAKRFEHYTRLIETRNDALQNNGGGQILSAVVGEISAQICASSQKLQNCLWLPAFVRDSRFIGRLFNVLTLLGTTGLIFVVLAIIGLPVLVSVAVGIFLFYFSRKP